MEAEAMEERYLLSCSHGLLSLLPYTTQDLLPTVGWILLHQSPAKKRLTDLTVGQSYGRIFSTESPFS